MSSRCGYYACYVPWLKTAATAIVLLVVCGCGSQIVQPGGAKRPLPVAIRSQQSHTVNSRATETNSANSLQNLPRVSASQVVSLPGRPQDEYYHAVKTGETLSSIAGRYRTTAERLIQANGLDRSAVIQPGQLIYIPR